MRRSRSTLLAVLLLTVSTAPRAGAADRWTRITSNHFIVIGNASESAIRRVAVNLERFRAGFVKLFPAIEASRHEPTRVIVFKSDGAFRPFKPQYRGRPANLTGFFQPGADADYIALGADEPTPLVVYHEFIHSLTKHEAAALPLWVVEGLAEFYGTFDVDQAGKEMLIGKPIEWHLSSLRQNYLDLGTLLAVGRDSPYYNEQSRQGVFYAASWALVHYLMLADNGARQMQFANFLGSIERGKTIDGSFREAFHTDIATLERQLRSYVERSVLPVVRLPLPRSIDADDQMTRGVLTDAEAQYYLGDLLLQEKRVEEAEMRFRESLMLDPALAPSCVSMGLVRLQQDNLEDAFKYFARAVEADSDNYLAHYYYAYLLQIAKHDDDERSRFALMRDHLKKAISLAPDYLNAYELLADVALASTEDRSATQELLERALSAPRGAIRLTVAELMIRNRETAAAQALLKPMAAADEDDPLHERARALLSEIQDVSAHNPDGGRDK